MKKLGTSYKLWLVKICCKLLTQVDLNRCNTLHTRPLKYIDALFCSGMKVGCD